MVDFAPADPVVVRPVVVDLVAADLVKVGLIAMEPLEGALVGRQRQAHHHLYRELARMPLTLVWEGFSFNLLRQWPYSLRAPFFYSFDRVDVVRRSKRSRTSHGVVARNTTLLLKPSGEQLVSWSQMRALMCWHMLGACAEKNTAGYGGVLGEVEGRLQGLVRPQAQYRNKWRGTRQPFSFSMKDVVRY